MSSKLMKNIKDRSKPNDKIYTPPQIVDLMLNYLDEETETILDPCRGGGAFYDKLCPERRLWCEMEDARDFFSFENKVDTIIGNPPYSILTKWLDHSYDIAQKKIIYIIGMYSLTPARLTRAEKKGFYVTNLLLTQVPTWFQRSYIVFFVKVDKPEKISFEFMNLGNKCLYCGYPCGGMRGPNIKHCERKAIDLECYY